jgi:hypothetical protein
MLLWHCQAGKNYPQEADTLTLAADARLKQAWAKQM